MRAVVVGAGLGGLCAAHGLRRAGLEVEVLEARDRTDDRAQGYRININAAGHEALRACLDASDFRAYEQTLHRQSDPKIYMFSPGLELLFRNAAPGAPGAADRAALRRVLADGLAGRISFGRKVATVTDAGPADLIVAADGVGSALRQELLPGTGPQPLGISAIFGRGPLRPGWTPPAVLNSRFCGIVEGTTSLALCAYAPETPGTTDPYVMWVLICPTGDLPDRDMSGDELLRFARERTAAWDPRATAVLRESSAGDCFLTPLRSFIDIPEIPARPGIPVAFLGDAIHAMSPAGGEGANTALRDAALLTAHVRAGAPLADAVAAYHDQMRTMAGEALQRSATYAPKEKTRA
jgi:salicylate hydroxylase